MEKPILSLVEHVKFSGEQQTFEFDARIDTGAQNSSIDLVMAQKLKLGPIIKTKSIRNSHGITLRPVVEATITLQGKTLTAEFTISNRTKMKYKALIGQNILKEGFLIDPSQGAKK